MNYLALIKFLYESKLLMLVPGVASLLLLGYVEAFQLPEIHEELTGVQDAVKSLQKTSLEERLDAAYAALCMNPGDPAVLERIRDLQQEYEEVAQKRYDPPSCDLLFKLK